MIPILSIHGVLLSHCAEAANVEDILHFLFIEESLCPASYLFDYRSLDSAGRV